MLVIKLFADRVHEDYEARPPAAGVLMARTLVLIASIAIIGLLAFLTVKVAVEEGIDILVVLSLVVLALLGFGVLGALSSRPPDG